MAHNVQNDGDPFPKQITDSDLVAVLDCLEKLPTQWYTIGLHLGVAKEKLDQIERDYMQQLPRQIIEMINMWIADGNEHTWKHLASVLARLGYVKAARLAASNDPNCEEIDEIFEHVINDEPQDDQEFEQDNKKEHDIQELKQDNKKDCAKLVLTEEAEKEEYIKFNTEMLELKKKTMSAMNGIRKFLGIPDSTSDESLWENMEMHTSKFVHRHPDYLKLADLISRVAKSMYLQQEALHNRASKLSQSMNQTCLLLQKRAFHDEVEMLAAHADPIVTAEESFHSQEAYAKLLYKSLHNCLYYVEKKNSQNERISKAASSFLSVCKCIMCATNHRIVSSLFTMIVALLIFASASWYSTKIVAMAISVLIIIEFFLTSTSRYMFGDALLRLFAGVLNRYNHHRVRQICSIFSGVVIGLALVTQNVIQGHSDFQETVLINFLVIEWSHFCWLVGTVLGFLIVIICYRFSKLVKANAGLINVTFFLLFLPYFNVLAYVNLYLLGGMNIGMLATGITVIVVTDAKGTACLLATYFIGFLSPLLGAIMGLYAGLHLSRVKMVGAFIGASFMSASIALLGLKLTKSWSLVYYNMDLQVKEMIGDLRKSAKGFAEATEMIKHSERHYEELPQCLQD